MDVETSLQKLFSLHTFGIKLGLDNTIHFLDHLGNPQKKLQAIHVAGSNGKGSTSSFIASILQESGYKTGLYTSPHFIRFNERIVINGKQIEDEYIADFVSENARYIDEYQLTFFEVTTAMAFKYFLDMQTEICAIETGLGGRLDATNVLKPLAVVITTISLEHTNVLGNTLAQIAAEKAAIIKNGVNVFTGMLKNEAIEIIQQKCKETNSKLFPLENFLVNEDQNVKILFDQERSKKINSPLKGKYQKYNAGLAVLTLCKTIPTIQPNKFGDGIKNVLLNTGIQGRYEFFNRSPDIIFDSAHNPDGLENFLIEFSKESGLYKKKSILFGAMRDKSLSEMFKLLAGSFDKIFISKIEYERAATIEELGKECENLKIPYETVEDPSKFVNQFRKRSKDECLVILGSMYLLGEIKQHLNSSIA